MISVRSEEANFLIPDKDIEPCLGCPCHKDENGPFSVSHEGNVKISCRQVDGMVEVPAVSHHTECPLYSS